MKLISAQIDNLLGSEGRIEVNFNQDINVITGKNGAGKTTFLKLIWYIISGNIAQAVAEINFTKATIQTSEYTCSIFRLNSSTCRAQYDTPDGKSIAIEDGNTDSDEPQFFDARDELAELLYPIGSSLFFPTFRRIEGGFSMGKRRTKVSFGDGRSSRALEEAMNGLAQRMSNNDHLFITSISTFDIESMLLKSYASLSEESNKLQQSTSNDIIAAIRDYKDDHVRSPDNNIESIRTANQVIDSVRQKIERMESARNEIMLPMQAIRKLMSKFFSHSGIKFGPRLSFGDAASAINSDALSAGEKQMLSFICYNALRKNCIAFIDEPELSLHVDWQRLIFPTLLQQNSGNQFIVATHSPFIYSKYPDKEICIDLNGDKGDNFDNNKDTTDE